MGNPQNVNTQALSIVPSKSVWTSLVGNGHFWFYGSSFAEKKDLENKK